MTRIPTRARRRNTQQKAKARAMDTLLEYAAPSHAPAHETSRPRGIAALTVATVIWGSTFVVIHEVEVRGANTISPGMLVLARFLIAALVFLPALSRDRRLWVAGIELGFWLWCGYGTQAIGLKYTNPARSAF